VTLTATPLQDPADVEWCARLMAASEPWITLRRDYAACRALLENPAKECYLARAEGERAGFIVLDVQGALTGYIQTICIAPHARGRGLGAQLIAWAEERIFRDSPNVFMCVSSFNPDARRLYERLGYETVGVLTGYVVDEHDEILLRKRRASWESFRRARAGPGGQSHSPRAKNL
jgi:ribosomal protein S18 acetylase RimI-like enzyme